MPAINRRSAARELAARLIDPTAPNAAALHALVRPAHIAHGWLPIREDGGVPNVSVFQIGDLEQLDDSTRGTVMEAEVQATITGTSLAQCWDIATAIDAVLVTDTDLPLAWSNAGVRVSAIPGSLAEEQPGDRLQGVAVSYTVRLTPAP